MPIIVFLGGKLIKLIISFSLLQTDLITLSATLSNKKIKRCYLPAVSLLWKVLSEILVRRDLVTCNIGQTLKSFGRGEISSYYNDKKITLFWCFWSTHIIGYLIKNSKIRNSKDFIRQLLRVQEFSIGVTTKSSVHFIAQSNDSKKWSEN